ncbi:Flagellar biosynthesis anti-sigma factor FlgM [Rubrivivax sp. A210]|uniref:flagellar biosynthesis anti-sigma factor FlgM n=1 Tax=Rubrivivax sp. A210 TaxID=2772301 RepID=UPI001917D25F|nr:flagellar biosynthesis anti-sigma factor FlgM [Rubrivivax sp. A210]CAD5374751.1 Flagellar biosynthesis anti-sigma factor FlgM [Rubrivivax sp. A210]
MKIGPLDAKPVAPPATAERKGQPAAVEAEASAKVDLSPAASLMSGMAADPTFDSAKVDRIAQAIRDGQFKVNPEAIADKLILNAQELLGRQFS